MPASEIAGLKLGAGWVILPACNTAAGEATGARAFICAQARALLVSHWSAAAAVKPITAAMRDMPRDGKAGRAKALRRAVLTLIGKGEVKEAPPAYWAPFVVVG